MTSPVQPSNRSVTSAWRRDVGQGRRRYSPEVSRWARFATRLRRRSAVSCTRALTWVPARCLIACASAHSFRQ